MAAPLSIKLKFGSSSASASSSSSSSTLPAPPTHPPTPSTHLPPHSHSPSHSHSPNPVPHHQPQPTPQPTAAAPPPLQPQQPPTPAAPAPAPSLQPPPPDGEDERPVSAHKYRDLKRKYLQQTESQNDTSLALYRAQKLIHRLREEKSSLLDRVLHLESSANLTSPEVDAAQEEVVRSHHAQSFPLLHPPPLPSLADRPRPTPILNTSTDLTHSTYNDPIGDPPRPLSFPPRQRSTHLVSQLAAQKLRNDNEARRTAQGLPKPSFHAVSILGLEGSYVAENVERAMLGEQFPEPGAVYVEQKSASGGGGGTKRRRGSESSGRGKAKLEPPGAVYQGLPNPFAGAGATPVPPPVEASPSAVPQQHYGSASVEPQPHPHGDVDMDDDTRSFGTGAGYSEDEGAGGAGGGAGGAEPKEFVVKERKHRKIEGEKTIKPKRLKTHGITSGTYQIPHVPRNPDGTPRLPIPIGIMILRKLGTVTPREHFHTERYIFPIGFEAMRKYPSMIDRTETVEYSCTIVDGGDGAPRFEIHPADQPGVIISAGTPTGAWSQVVKAANRVRERNHSNSVSGPDYYGLAQNVVKALIQELPGAREVPGYIWQTFLEDPDPAIAGEEGGRKRKGAGGGEGGPKKVTGARRKARLESEGVEESYGSEGGGHQGYGYGGQHQQQQYDGLGGSNGGYESSQRSPSPVTSPGGGYPSHSHQHDGYNAPSSSLASLLHHAAQAQAQVTSAPPPTDPYALPGALPPSSSNDPYQQHRSPSFSAPAPSPYALPSAPPVDPYAIPPPASSSNHFAQSPPLQQQGSPHLQQGGWGGAGAGAVDPMFQQQQHGQQFPPPPPPPAGGSPALDPSFF